MKRESFRSRLGSLLVSAGCAVGIGNVWKFPYVTGENGGGVFVLFYLIFLLLMGVPVLTMELAVGRASRRGAVLGYQVLKPARSKWHIHGWFCVAGCIDNFGWSRKKAALTNGAFVLIASIPCVLGYNLWYFEAALPNGSVGQILDIEGFLVSNLLLPLGSLVYLLFCATKWGWGFDKYLEEANAGKGIKMPRALKPYFQLVLPVLILVILIQGLLK